jgi:DNA-binding transcriptional MerR regulator
MLIAEVCSKFNLTPDALRYYERMGLIPAIKRTSHGIRDYSEKDCGWIGFVKCMRNAGVQVGTLAEYVKLFKQGDITSGERKQILIRERSRISKHVSELQEVLARLDCKIEKYDTDLKNCEAELRDAIDQ